MLLPLLLLRRVIQSFPLCPFEVSNTRGSIVAVLMVLVWTGGECDDLVGGSRVRVGLAIQKDEDKTRSGNDDGVSVGGGVARSVHNVTQFA